MKEITFTIDSYSFSTVPNNSCCREQCCSEISDKTGKTYFWMREETGNKNWVLYNPNEYYVRKDSEYRCIYIYHIVLKVKFTYLLMLVLVVVCLMD